MPGRFALTAAALALASTLHAQEPDAASLCDEKNPERVIAGCTAFIDAGSHSEIELAQAFANRAFAFATWRVSHPGKHDLRRCASNGPILVLPFLVTTEGRGEGSPVDMDLESV